MEKHTKSKRELIRVGKHLKELVTVKDSEGNILHKSLRATMVEIYPRDVMQLIIGATLLSIPIGFTEEVWMLGEQLPSMHIALTFLLSLFFIALFVYYNFYRHHFEGHKVEFIKRVFLIYFVSLVIAFLLLTLIEKGIADGGVATTIKRMILISFPASMSAAVADMLK